MSRLLTPKQAETLLALSNGESVLVSALPSSLKEEFLRLRADGIMETQNPHHWGGRISVVKQNPFLSWLQHKWPSGLEAVIGNHSVGDRRTDGQMKFRDTKALSGLGFGFAHMKLSAAIEPEPKWGGVSLVLDEGAPPLPWPETGPVKVAMIENTALFRRVSPEAIGVDAMVFMGGRISSHLLNWMSRQPSRLTFPVMPDYDYAGLLIYLAISERLGERAHLVVPDDLPRKMALYGNRTLISTQDSEFRSLSKQLETRPEMACKAVTRVMAAIQRHGVGLEQEIYATAPEALKARV